MNHENQPTSHESETNSQNFDQLVSEINGAAVNILDKLRVTNAKAAREEFLANPNLTRPNNVYGNLDPEEISHNLDTLNHVDDELNTGNFPDKQARFARLIATDYRNANNFVAANITYNTAETPEEKFAAAEYHRETNEALYGKIDEDTFYSLLSDKLSKINVDQLTIEDHKQR